MYIWRNNGKEQGSEVAERDAACARLEVILMIDCILKAWIIGIRKKKSRRAARVGFLKQRVLRGASSLLVISEERTHVQGRTEKFKGGMRLKEGANIEKNILFL